MWVNLSLGWVNLSQAVQLRCDGGAQHVLYLTAGPGMILTDEEARRVERLLNRMNPCEVEISSSITEEPCSR